MEPTSRASCRTSSAEVPSWVTDWSCQPWRSGRQSCLAWVPRVVQNLLNQAPTIPVCNPLQLNFAAAKL